MLTKKVPYIAQMEAVECGAASLAMVLAFRGHHAPLSEVRQACGVSRDGATAMNIVAAARGYGLETRALSLEPDDLREIEVPAILHWEMNHFVVLERWTEDRVTLVDPAQGRRTVTPEAFHKAFTGICIELTPGEAFEPRAREAVSRGRYLGLLRGAGRALGMVLVASLALNVLSLVLPVTTQIVVDDVVGKRRADWLWLAAGSAAALVTFSAMYSLLREGLLVRVRRALDTTITSSFVDHLLDLPVPFYAQRSAADLMNRVQSNRTIRDVLAGQSIALLAGGVMMLAYLGLMFVFDAKMSAWVLAAAFAYVVVYLVARPHLLASADESQRKSVAAESARLQIVRGIATIKSAGATRTSHTRWLNAWIEALNAGGRVALRQQLVGSLLYGIQAAVPVVILWVGGRRVLAGDLSVGRLVAFQMLQAGFLGPLDQIVRTLVRLQILPVLLGRMDDVLLSAREPTRDIVCPRLEGTLHLDGVSFRYGTTRPDVLSDISLQIDRGKKVAFVGPSGSGKSTLARILLGLYAPTSGRVLFDGHDLSTLDLPSVRRQIGVVLQETALFEGTIADNLRLFYPSLPLEQVIQAARVAQIHDDIQALPEGYETRIRGGGGPLSGGQRQRIALARAIVHRPPIMILDEATSALDAVTEAAIERYLSTRACTRIVIAHRLSTVRDADTIFVMEAGRIVEQGRHDDLAAAGGLYARLLASAEAGASEAARASERPAIGAADLAGFAPFRAWSERERGDLAGELVRFDVAAGTRIVEQDARASGLFFLLEGDVRIELAEPGLAPWTVARLGPGAVFGEIGLLDGSPSSASVLSEGAVRTLHLPYARFQELSQRGDDLAVRAVLALGALVAERLRDAVTRHAELTEEGSPAPTPGDRGGSRGRELTLGQTFLGAPLSADEVASVERIARRRTLRRGEELFASGTAADAVYVLLAGRIAARRGGRLLAIVPAGATLAEAAIFDDAAHVMDAAAIEDGVVLVLPRDRVLDLITSGQRVAHKMLGALAQGLVRQSRLANFRLREAAALRDGEVDRAHAARESALATAKAEREALLVPGHGQIPLVRAGKEEDAPAACLTSLLRSWGRPLSLDAVTDAFAATASAPDAAFLQAARALGLSCRRLDLVPGELSFAEGPVVALLTDRTTGTDETADATPPEEPAPEEPSHEPAAPAQARWAIVQRRPFGRFQIMDPRRGSTVVSASSMSDSFTGLAFEVRAEEDSTAPSASLLERVASFAKGHFADLGRLFALSLFLQGVAMATSLATAAAVARVFPLRDAGLFHVILAVSVAMAVAGAVAQQLQARAIEHLRARFDRSLLDQMMSHVLKLPIAFFDRFGPGHVLQRFQAFESVRVLFSTQGIAALLCGASLLVGTVLLFAFEPTLAPIALGVLLVHAAAAALLFSPLKRGSAEVVLARGREQERMLEVLQGIVTLRMSGDRAAAHQRWLPAFLDDLDKSVRQDRMRAFAQPPLEWVRAIGTVAVLALGARAVLDGTTTIAALVAFLGVFGTFLAATSGMTSQVLVAAQSLVDYGLVRATFQEPREQASRVLVSPGRLRGKVSVEQVSFRYDGDGPLILKDVSLEIASGTKVALVGASGSGKSTLGKLLLGLYLPTSGRISFDGKDVATLDLEALRQRMGVVLQDPFLVAGSIRENIALGAEDASFDRIVDAAQKAAIHDDIESMPMGYSTLVSEGGTAFSGGQRQRCVIARALVSKPAVLLLDEATSALDNLSQAAVERHLSDSSATRIVVAHRLSTVIDSDLIVVLDKGRVVEKGRHEELLAKKGAYFELVRAQLGDGLPSAGPPAPHAAGEQADRTGPRAA